MKKPKQTPTLVWSGPTLNIVLLYGVLIIRIRYTNGAKTSRTVHELSLQEYTSSVSSMIDHLQWKSLESRKSKIHLTLFFKVIHNLIDIPAKNYLTPSTKRARARKAVWSSPSEQKSIWENFLPYILFIDCTS